MSKTVYVKSTSPGKSWGICFIKAPKRPGYWSATEGTLEHTASGFTSFSFMMFAARQERGALISSPVTAAKQKAALAEFMATLKAKGLVADGAAEAA
jgi:hypothetical protein